MLRSRDGRSLGETSGGVDEVVSHDARLWASPWHSSQISCFGGRTGVLSPAGNWIPPSFQGVADLLLLWPRVSAIALTSLLKSFFAFLNRRPRPSPEETDETLSNGSAGEMEACTTLSSSVCSGLEHQRKMCGSSTSIPWSQMFWIKL